jgi:hypothetical protein
MHHVQQTYQQHTSPSLSLTTCLALLSPSLRVCSYTVLDAYANAAFSVSGSFCRYITRVFSSTRFRDAVGAGAPPLDTVGDGGNGERGDDVRCAISGGITVGETERVVFGASSARVHGFA